MRNTISRFQISPTTLGVLALTLTATMGGTSYSISKYLMRFFNPNELLTYRFFFGVIALILIYPRAIRSFTFPKLVMALPTGLTLGVAMLVLWQGVKSTDTGLSAFIVNSEFILIPIISYILFRERISQSTILLVLFGFLGMGLLTLKDGFTISYGVSLLLVSVTLFAFYVILNTKISRRMDPLELCVLNLSIGAAVSAFGSVIEGFKFEFSTETIWHLIYLGPIMTGIRFYFATYGQSKVEATHTGLIYLCEPITASLIGYFIMDEVFTGSQTLGMLLLVGTVIGNFFVIKGEEIAEEASNGQEFNPLTDSAPS